MTTTETQTTTPTAPVPGSEEHLQAMADKYRTQGQEEELPGVSTEPEVAQVPPLPEGGFDKFYDKTTGTYDWANHAKELQYRLDQVKAGKSEEPKQEEPKEESQGEVSDVLTRAGLNAEELGQIVVRDGNIPVEARQALLKQGIPEALIDAYIDNFKFRVEAEQAKSLEYVGGPDEWDRISSWAQRNLSEAEKGQINQVLAGPGWKLGVDALKARMGLANPASSEGALETGGVSFPGSNVDGYRSRDEMKRDMGSREYQQSATFREKVLQKMRRATWDLDNNY